jgi:hypothetical protein
MIGTKIYARILGHLDAEMVLAELGEKEVFRKTETMTSGSAGGQAGSVSVGWAKEKIGVAKQEELAELGPKKTGIDALVQGFGKDPILICFPYINTPPRRAAFITNENFNKPIFDSLQTAHVDCVNTTKDELFTQTTEPAQIQQVPAVHPDYAGDANDEHMLIIQTSETREFTVVNANDEKTVHADDTGGTPDEKAGENAISEVLGEALGIDAHAIEIGIELAEIADENTCKQQADTDVAAVVVCEKNTGKRGLFKKRNQRKHEAGVRFQEGEQ